MEHLLKIMTKPDNIPIVLMLGLTIFYTWFAARKGLKNDRQEVSEEAKLADKVQVWPYRPATFFHGINSRYGLLP